MRTSRDDLDLYVHSRDAREPGFKAKLADAEARAETRAALDAKLKKARGSGPRRG